MTIRPELYPQLKAKIERFVQAQPSATRKVLLDPIAAYIIDKRREGSEVHLNFICTHNSRRSQMAQIWAQLAAFNFDIKAKCYSGGLAVTAFNERAAAAMERCGFIIEHIGQGNPVYSVKFSDSSEALKIYSKQFDDPQNPKAGFAAVMTCSEADKDCPIIVGAERRLSLLYDDPKLADGSKFEASKYDERANQIGTEMMYIFSLVNRNDVSSK